MYCLIVDVRSESDYTDTSRCMCIPSCFSIIFTKRNNTVDSRYLEDEGTSETLRDIRTSTHQNCRMEETTN